MRFKHEQTFPFTIDTAWKALHKPSSLDIAPRSEVTVTSDTEWTTQTIGSDKKGAVLKLFLIYDFSD